MYLWFYAYVRRLALRCLISIYRDGWSIPQPLPTRGAGVHNSAVVLVVRQLDGVWKWWCKKEGPMWRVVGMVAVAVAVYICEGNDFWIRWSRSDGVSQELWKRNSDGGHIPYFENKCVGGCALSVFWCVQVCGELVGCWVRYVPRWSALARGTSGDLEVHGWEDHTCILGTMQLSRFGIESLLRNWRRSFLKIFYLSSIC